MSPEYRIFQKNASSSNFKPSFWRFHFFCFWGSMSSNLFKGVLRRQKPQFFRPRNLWPLDLLHALHRPVVCPGHKSRRTVELTATNWSPLNEGGSPIILKTILLGMSFCSITLDLTQQAQQKQSITTLTYLEVLRSSIILTNKSTITGVS